jgi:hypothetical protein
MNPITFLIRLARPPQCITCAYLIGEYCYRPRPDLVNSRTGLTTQGAIALGADYERSVFGDCGLTGRFWQKKSEGRTTS